MEELRELLEEGKTVGLYLVIKMTVIWEDIYQEKHIVNG